MPPIAARKYAERACNIMIDELNRWKLAAAELAVTQAVDGMILGLGTGSTAALAMNALGKRVREGLRVIGIPTSERTAAQARALDIPLAALADYDQNKSCETSEQMLFLEGVPTANRSRATVVTTFLTAHSV